jgi:hypothetical protein
MHTFLVEAFIQKPGFIETPVMLSGIIDKKQLG